MPIAGVVISSIPITPMSTGRAWGAASAASSSPYATMSMVTWAIVSVPVVSASFPGSVSYFFIDISFFRCHSGSGSWCYISSVSWAVVSESSFF